VLLHRTEAQVVNKKQRRILLPEDASIRGPSNSRKNLFLAEVVQSV